MENQAASQKSIPAEKAGSLLSGVALLLVRAQRRPALYMCFWREGPIAPAAAARSRDVKALGWMRNAGPLLY
jgi:hypothetical protein